MISRAEADLIINDPSARLRVSLAAIEALPGNGNRCAATLTLWLREWGIMPDTVMFHWTASLLSALPMEQFRRIHYPKDVQPLDLIICEDNNRNGAPDHVGIALSGPGDSPMYLVKFLDNQHGFAPYMRNLGSGPKTPMQYALRPLWASDEAVDALEDMKTIYNHLKSTTAPRKVYAAFNRIRRLPGMPPI